ncbi:DUF5365 family protein [Bacillus sp. REN10]|uniref:DUF5365 family protein n=1 Tax=Bacillus sp. REN10 TaxID=2782541 RepID=UPI00193BDCED|nr:DUF5365 family protein [Bacillus sp. REN10]
MKVFMASTKEQEEKIAELVCDIKERILPRFFADEELQQMHKLDVLNITKVHNQSFHLLRDAFKVIASLQTIISILETKDPSQLSAYYEEMFQRNVDILKGFDLHFPYLLSQFHEKKDHVVNMVHVTPVNKLLI